MATATEKKDKRLFQSQRMRGFRTKIRTAEKKAGAALYALAQSLHAARRVCADGDQFRRWLMDPVDGLGYTNPRRPLNLVKAFDIVGGERDKILWERLGYDGGISKLTSIPLVAERKAVIKAVKDKLGANGRGKLTGNDWNKILESEAPSLKTSRETANENEVRARLREMEQILKMYRSEMRSLAKKMPILVDVLPEAIREDAGIRRSRSRSRI